MKILYLMTEPFGIGGVQSDVLTLTEDLTAKGHIVYVATTDGVLLKELIGKGAIHVDIDFHFSAASQFVRALKQLREVVKREGIELVAPQSVRSSMVAYAALRLMPYGYRVASTSRRVPIVTTIHNIHNPKNFKWAGRILRQSADFIIFESNYERNRLLANGLPPEQSTVIHSGIDLDRFSTATRTADFARQYGLEPGKHLIFGIVARLSEEKGHNFLVDAFAKVVQRKPETRLLIVGDGPLLDQTKAQVARLGLQNTVIFAGMQRDIPSHLALLDVFVLSSTRESFPLSAREAMAAGRCVIAPRIGGCGEVVEDGVTGLLFTAADVDDLAAKMLTLSERDTVAAMGRAGRQRAERLFSRHVWVDGDEKVYLDWAGLTSPSTASVALS
ncbi:glycosyltransferase family 4 protein [Thiomonas arsenitoxydans]|jgi:glycosyltransferase involved in cell wall biosynthesis|uniref:glycosyltransferase family 4 protein n=1 Tax=Thiomonas arsenitoxydans (strain DSM 22701 / CIP 110005 / 3As) TaxID=426114 RepID=UPI001AD2A873|nr:glycosyltransferase family 4 protein [Thiomonas arsenitoxydans]MBN8777828.1 glycosyltransferase family 4 protein [Thiomonas arsenitoxydans]